jgi:uncharacterized membrane protein YgdD (TMEM256/DUF423 family)
MNKRIILTASVLGMIAVILGAFGAHGLKGRVTDVELDNWKTAVNYQFYHVLALLFLSGFEKQRSSLINIAFYAFTLGIILFSGSLYLLSTRSVTGFYWSALGPITPIGGILLIFGWISLFFSTLKHK